MEIVYFQPKGIRPQYCEAGIIHESDPEHIWYLYEPCKILISEVKIIPKDNIRYDKKNNSYLVCLVEEDDFYCCVECGREMDDMEHNYGTDTMPCCIQCYVEASNMNH